jgi:hypothetical protein
LDEKSVATPRGPLGLDYRQIPVEHFLIGVVATIGALAQRASCDLVDQGVPLSVSLTLDVVAANDLNHAGLAAWERIEHTVIEAVHHDATWTLEIGAGSLPQPGFESISE